MKIKIVLIYAMIVICNHSLSSKSTNPFIISVPKAGTHLLSKCLYLLTNREELFKGDPFMFPLQEIFNLLRYNIYTCHAIYTKANHIFISRNNLKGFFIYRDPRDQIISFMHWAYKHPTLYPTISTKEPQELILTLIYHWGTHMYKYYLQNPVENIANIYRFYYLPWQNVSNVYTTTFEKLVGPQGGGNLAMQIKEIMNIARHININITEERAYQISQELFGYTNTFRNGKIGEWKKYFTPTHKNIFKQVAGKLLIELRYENDMNW